MTYESIIYEADDRVATITFNRPQRMNALSQALCAEFRDAVAKADADDEVRVLIVTGAGGKACSSGYELLDPDSRPEDRTGIGAWHKRLAGDLDFTYTVWNCSKPVIAMIDGYCLAGALEFAQMCDMRYCSDDSRFAVIESRFSAGIATLAMPWILGARCRELIYTGDMIDAEEALRLGLVNRVFPKDALAAETMKIAKRMSRVALDCLKWNKRAINQSYDTMGFKAALQYGLEACVMLDSTETPELKAFTEIRVAKGAKEAIKWRDAQFKPFE